VGIDGLARAGWSLICRSTLRFIDRGADSRLAQSQRSRRTGDAAADDQNCGHQISLQGVKSLRRVPTARDE
jgi:hypothetical protein